MRRIEIARFSSHGFVPQSRRRVRRNFGEGASSKSEGGPIDRPERLGCIPGWRRSTLHDSYGRATDTPGHLRSFWKDGREEHDRGRIDAARDMRGAPTRNTDRARAEPVRMIVVCSLNS